MTYSRFALFFRFRSSGGGGLNFISDSGMVQAREKAWGRVFGYLTHHYIGTYVQCFLATIILIFRSQITSIQKRSRVLPSLFSEVLEK